MRDFPLFLEGPRQIPFNVCGFRMFPVLFGRVYCVWVSRDLYDLIYVWFE